MSERRHVVTGSSHKPMRLGPIYGMRINGSYVLHMPFMLQGEWTGDRESQQKLQGLAERSSQMVEARLVEEGRYVPRDAAHSDTPVELTVSESGDSAVIRVRCEDEKVAKPLADMVKRQMEMNREIEIMSPMTQAQVDRLRLGDEGVNGDDDRPRGPRRPGWGLQ